MSVPPKGSVTRQPPASPLLHTQALMRDVLDAEPVMMGLVEIAGADYRIVSVNPAAAKWYGLSPESIRGRLASELGEPVGVISTWIDRCRESEQTGGVVRFGYECLRAEGIRWLVATVAPVPATPASQDAPPRFAFIVEDATSRHASERTAPPANAVVDSITDVFLSLDRQGRFTYANRQAEITFAKRREEIIGHPARDVFPEALGTLFETECRRALHEQIPLRFDEFAPSQGAWFEVHAYPNQDGLSVFMTDVTERKQAEARLLDLSQRLQFHVENSPFAVVEFSTDFHITRWSDEAERVFGWSAEEALGKSMWELSWIHPDDQDKVHEISEAMTSGRRARNAHPNRNVRKDGRVIWCVWYNSALLDAHGAMISILSLVHDVTAEREAQEQQKRLLADLAESREQYRTMGEAIPYGVWRTNAQGEAEYFSQSFLDLLQMTEDEMRDYGWMRRLPPDVVQPLRDRWLNCVRTGEPWESEHRILGPDGRYHTVLCRGLPVRNEQGAITSWVGINLDIDDRKAMEEALRESEARFRTMADNIAPLAWMADETGWLFWYNRRWFDYTGTTFEQMEGWGWRAVHHPDHFDRVVERWNQCLRTGEPWEDIFPLRSAAGEYRWFLSRALPVRDASGRILRWFGTNTDITEQLQMQDELRRQTAELAEADQAKANFLAMLAHELRNPLSAISNAAELLRARGHGDPSETRAIDVLRRQTRQMSRLVEDLMDASRINRGTLNLQVQPLDLVEVVHRAAEVVRVEAEKGGQDLALALAEDPLLVSADPARLEQVIVNVLGNALKFTPAGGHIRVTVLAEGGQGVVTVRDDGEGISPDALPGIFGLFAQGDTPRHSRAGLGIGLALARQIVEMHGGTITAESDGPGHGSTFTIRIPLAAGPQA